MDPTAQPVLFTLYLFLKILVADAESSRATSVHYLAHNFNKIDSPFYFICLNLLIDTIVFVELCGAVMRIHDSSRQWTFELVEEYDECEE